jgi:hypothetical protein
MTARRMLGMLLGLLLLASTTTCAFAQAVTPDVKHDISPPLGSVRAPLKAQGAFLTEHRVKRLPPLPSKLAALADTALQKKVTKKLAIGLVTTFPGVGLGNYAITADPPDTVGSVGTTQYVQWVNTGFAVFDKSNGNMVLGPLDGNLIWTGFGGNCENFNDGDPIVLFDKTARRWLLTQFAVTQPPFSQCVAVSTSEDATGTYARYEFQFQDFNDYPKFGVWPDGYYGTFNMFRGNAFLGSKVCAFERAKMLDGQGARMQCFDVANEGGLLPADLDGATAPPAGAPSYVMNFGSDRLNLWKFHVDWTTPASSTFTGPTSIKTAPFTPACDSGPTPGVCVKQPRTAQRLDTLSDRLMFRLAYRNFGAHESLVANHSVAAGTASGVRWYEVRNPATTPVIQQQGTYAPGTLFRWMGSVAMDKLGNIAMGYSVSGSTTFPNIRFTGRAASDPPNQMGVEQVAVKGVGSQTRPDRWGDYSSMSIDPTDDCTFWFTTQYLGKTGNANWQTSVVHFKFASCQ